MGAVDLRRHLQEHLAEWIISGALCLLLCGVWAVAVHMARESERDAMVRAEAQARDLAEVLSLQWIDVIHRIEYLQLLGRVTSIATLSNDPHQPETLGALRDATKSAGSGIVQVAGIDAAGDVIWSTNPLPPGKINLSGREHFQAIAQQGLDRFVGRAVVGAVSGQRTLQFASAVRGSDKSLKAVTVVSVNFDDVRALENRLARVGRGVVTIERLDGVILARSQGGALPIGSGQRFTRLLETNSVVSGLSTSPIDGVRRFFAVRLIPDYEMFLFVGLDANEQMAPAYKAGLQVQRVAAWLGCSLVLLAFASIIAVRRNRDAKFAHLRAIELEQSETLLRQIAEPATDLISLHDRKFRFIYANPACQTLLGFEATSLFGLRLNSIVSPADLPFVEDELADLSVHGGSRRLAMRINHKDGKVRWLESEIVAIEPSSNLMRAPAGYVVISRDITQRVHDSEALREVEQEFAALAELAPGRLYRIVFDSNGTSRLKFPGEGMLFGYPQNHLEDTDFLASKMDSDDINARSAAIKECLQTRHSVIEYRFRAASGDVCWVRDEMRLSTNEAGQRLIVGYMSNITSERDTNARMQQIERLATLGEVASGIAHEMNQPLAIIATAAENALRIGKRSGDLNPLIQKKLQRIMDQAHRVGIVIDHIRLVARSETTVSGQSDLAEIVQSVMILVQYRLQSVGANLVVDLPPDLPKLDVAAVPLEQVFVNLVINACDAYSDLPKTAEGPNDGRPVRITADASEAIVRIKVIDQAGGIPPAVIKRVFDPFFTTKPPGKGTGVGLAICLASIIEMGGTMSVHNENGGATFEIQLPRRHVHSNSPPVNPDRASTSLV